MPKVNVYLPDELYDTVRQAKLPLSAICQQALRSALLARSSAEALSRGEAVELPEPVHTTPAIGRHTAEILALAYEVAARRGSTEVETVDLLLGMCEEGETLSLQLLAHAGIAPSTLGAEAAKRSERVGEPVPVGKVRLSDAVREVLEQAAAAARSAGRPNVDSGRVLVAIADRSKVERADLGAQALVAAGFVRATFLSVSKVVDATIDFTRSSWPAPESAPEGGQPAVPADLVTEVLNRLQHIDRRLDRVERALRPPSERLEENLQ